MESVSKHSQAYIDLVSCKPFKKTSLPPLKYKLQDQLKQQTSFLELSNAEIAKRLLLRIRYTIIVYHYITTPISSFMKVSFRSLRSNLEHTEALKPGKMKILNLPPIETARKSNQKK